MAPTPQIATYSVNILLGGHTRRGEVPCKPFNVLKGLLQVDNALDDSRLVMFVLEVGNIRHNGTKVRCDRHAPP